MRQIDGIRCDRLPPSFASLRPPSPSAHGRVKLSQSVVLAEHVIWCRECLTGGEGGCSSSPACTPAWSESWRAVSLVCTEILLLWGLTLHSECVMMFMTGRWAAWLGAGDMDTLVVTECETHGDTLVAPAFGPRIKRVQGEYVRVILAGACPTCDGHATQDYREGSL